MSRNCINRALGAVALALITRITASGFSEWATLPASWGREGDQTTNKEVVNESDI